MTFRQIAYARSLTESEKFWLKVFAFLSPLTSFITIAVFFSSIRREGTQTMTFSLIVLVVVHTWLLIRFFRSQRSGWRILILFVLTPHLFMLFGLAHLALITIARS